MCDGRGATAHELHTPAPYLHPLAHPNRHGLHTHAHTNTHTTDYNWIHLMDTANCLDWQRGHGKWSGPGHLDKVVGFTNLSNIILIHSYLFVLQCEEMLCSCLWVCLVIVYCLVFVSTPVCKNGAGHQVYICSLFCLVGGVKSCQVCAFMWTLMFTADFCPLPHLEA